MQNTPNPHSQPIQSRKTQSPSQRRTPPRTRKTRLRRTKIPPPTRIRKNHQKTNTTPKMQSLRPHETQRRHQTAKTSNSITLEENENDRMEQTHPKTKKQLPTRKMPKMRQRTTNLQPRNKQSKLQRLRRRTRRTIRRQSQNQRRNSRILRVVIG
jgi:hypothetical protein